MLSEARHKQLMSGLNSTAKKVYEMVPIQDAWTVKQIGIQLHRGGTPQGQDVILACLDVMKRAGLISESKGCFQRVAIRRKKAQSMADLADVVRSGIEEVKEVVHDALHQPAGTKVEHGKLATPWVDSTPPPTAAPLGGLPSPPRPAPPMPPVQPAKPETKAPMNAPIQHSNAAVEILSGLSQSMHALILAQQRERDELDSRHRGEMAALAHAVADAGIEVQAELESISEEVKTARELKALMKRIGG